MENFLGSNKFWSSDRIFIVLFWRNGRSHKHVWSDVTGETPTYILGAIHESREYARKFNLASYRVRLTSEVN